MNSTVTDVNDAIIVGAGIGGLTLALALHRAGIAVRVYEAAPVLKPIGVGINLLPHATRELARLGLEAKLARVAVSTREAVFFNRFGQLIYREPLGRNAGYDWPQFSIHRGDLQDVLLGAVRERIGEAHLFLGWTCTGSTQDESGVVAQFRSSTNGEELPRQRGVVLVACDGLHSVIRKQLHPDEGEPLYSGVNMWRGVTRWQPILTSASMIRAGWLAGGKLVIYPIRDRIDGNARQLVNWVAEIETPRHPARDWNRRGRLEDFIGAFEDWHFDWLDVPRFLRAADSVLEFPMVDQDPLPWWSKGRVTLLGDAAHPMVPRGSNGAGQAILDARALADCLADYGDATAALKAYEDRRLEPTAKVVRMSRASPPDAILREVYRRTGDRPFRRIEDVISAEELAALSEGYKRVAGYDRESLQGEPR
ncbi:MAG TPA: flavin-dependent oxidoreductase [Casimicrobiaceae bacterium]|nr:flavin-dependent oxidoreductase [Casimicrobiaceae bacterium]